MKGFKWLLGAVLLCGMAVWLNGRFVAPSGGTAPASLSDPVQTLASITGQELAVPHDSVVLFIGGEETDVPWTSRTPAAKRVREIFPDPAWMTPEPSLTIGDVITLALFDDVTFTAKISRVTKYINGAVGLTAQLQGDASGTLYLSYTDGQMSAKVEVLGGADYAVDWRGGTHYAIEIDRAQSNFLEGADPKIPSFVADDVATDTVATTSAVEAASAGSVVIDVMIVYTPAALLSEGGTAAMDTNIALAMEMANEVHANSGTEVYLNLVYSAEIDYVEVTPSDDLYELTDVDGAMADVHEWRETYEADLVCLFESTEATGGLGWLLSDASGNAAHGFCLARVEQTESTYTVVHEWAHNMGCGHSATQTVESGPGLYSYSAGWQWIDSSTSPYGKCTVMTYENFYNTGNVFERVPYFSNPSIDYSEEDYDSPVPVGDVDDADNARTIGEMSSVIAAYRKASDLDYDGLPNEWELLYFGSETNANSAAIASNGVNTLLEAYIAGLDPTASDAFFEVVSSGSIEDGYIVSWSAVSGRVYAVYGTTNLVESFQPAQTNIYWPQSSWTDTVNRAEAFYKVEVQLEP
jgi:hypothetical protein